MERPWRKPGPLSFRYFVFRHFAFRYLPGHECASRGYCCFTNRQTPGARIARGFRILRGRYSLSLSAARLLSHVTTIAKPDLSRLPAQWHVICSLWTEFAKGDQGGSRFNLRFTQQIGEVNPSPFGTLFRLVQLQREVVMKALFGTMFGSAMLLASASAFAAGGDLQASSEEDQNGEEANKPQLV